MQATENSANKRYLLYGKASLRQIRALWLVLARSGFCSTDRVHGNGPRRVFLFWSKAGNFKIAIRTAKKKMWTLSFFIAKLPEKAKKIEILLRFQRWMKKTNILLASSVLSWTSGNFWFRKWNGYYRKSGGHRRFYQPTEKCKHKQEKGYWYDKKTFVEF